MILWETFMSMCENKRRIKEIENDIRDWMAGLGKEELITLGQAAQELRRDFSSYVDHGLDVRPQHEKGVVATSHFLGLVEEEINTRLPQT